MRVRRLVRGRDTARAEGQGQFPVRGEGSNPGRRERIALLRPDLRALQCDSVFIGRARLEVGNAYQGVMMPLDTKGARAVARAIEQRLDLAPRVGLHPDRGVASPGVPEEGAED